MKNNQSQKNILNGWNQVKLGDIGNSYSGLTGKNKEDFGFGKPFISYMNIYINWEINSNINDLVNIKDNDNQNQVKYGDIFFTTSSETPDEVGISSVLLNKNIGKVYLNSFCFGFRLHNFNILLPEYSKYFFRAKPFRDKMAIIAQGAIRFNLSKKYFNEVKLNLPPLPEQDRIVSVLEAWDKAIENLNKKIEVKKQIKKGLMQDLLTGKKRLSGFNEKWEILAIGSIGQVVTGNTPSKRVSSYYGNEFLWATALDFNGVYIEDTEIKLSESGKSVSRVVPSGSVLVTCIASIGKNAIAKRSMSFNQQINAIIPNKKHNSEFIYYLIENSFHKLKEVAGGGALAMISKGVFEKIKLNFPSLEEQTAIANILTTSDKEITELQNKLSIIKNQKKYLLDNLITGTIRTPETLSTKS